MQHRQRGRKRANVYTSSYSNGKRPRYSSANPPNLLCGEKNTGTYRTTIVPPRNNTRKRPPPQRPPSQRKAPPNPQARKPVKSSPVKRPLFPQQSFSGIPAEVNTNNKKKPPQQKKAPPPKRLIPKQAPKQASKPAPKPAPKRVQKRVPTKKPQKVAKPPTKKSKQTNAVKPVAKPTKAAVKKVTKPVKKSTQTKKQPAKVAAKPTKVAAKPTKSPVKPKTQTKPMKPKMNLMNEIKKVLIKERKRGDDDNGWEVHPELLAPINVTGKWRSAENSAVGAFHFKQEKEELIGHIENVRTPCTIKGKINTKERTVNFLQSFKKVKRITSVEVSGTVELTVMKTSFTYPDPDGGSPKKGEATLVQEPTGHITGVWAPLEQPINFHIFHYPNGLVLGYLDKPESCQVFGTLVDNKLRIQQEWIGNGSKVQCVGEVVGEDYLVLTYGYYKEGGEQETGTTKFFRKKKKLPEPPKIWNVSLVVDSNVQEEMKFTPQSAIIKQTFPSPKMNKVLIDNGDTEVMENAEFCVKSGDITWHREKFTKQILTRPIPYGIKLTKNDSGSSHYPLYYPDMKILILGEADFSFTLGLANKLKMQVGMKPLPNLVGTSYLEKVDVPRNIYPPNFQQGPMKRTYINENSNVNNNLLTITDLGAHVRFGVDARMIDETLRRGENAFCSPHALPRKFDRIIFPFPRASLKRTNWNEENALLRGLFISSKRELTNNGELHIILHTSKLGINQFDMWGIRDLAEDCGYVWRAALPFNFRLIPPYYPKDVASNKWTPFEASIQVFTPAKCAGWKVEKRLWRMPPSKEQKAVQRMSVCPLEKEYSESKYVSEE